jgi:hypothetical protein
MENANAEIPISNYLLWECCEKDACEAFPDGMPLFVNAFNSRFKGVDLETDGNHLRKMGSGIRTHCYNSYSYGAKYLQHTPGLL